MSISNVLESLNLAQYEDSFKTEGYDLDCFLGCETIEDMDKELKEAGISKKGHRIKLKRKLWKMKQSNSNNNTSDNNYNDQNEGSSSITSHTSTKVSQVDNELERMKKELELERLKLENEKMKLQNQRMREEEEIKQKEETFEKNFGLLDILGNNNDNNNNHQGKNFSINFDDGETSETLEGFEKSDTVKTLFMRYARFHFNSDSDDKLLKFDLTYSNVKLTANDWNKGLDNIKMGKKGVEFITVTWDVKGGTSRGGKKTRKLKKNIGLKITRGKCCILQIEDECAKMSCGHLISSFSMFHYIKSLIEKNLTIYKIVCPVPKCGITWNWDLCCVVADLTKDEYINYTAIVKRREKVGSGAFKTCPSCKVLLQRPKKLGKNRVCCTKCNGYDFCFICGQKWIAGGFSLCGNKNCSIYDKQKKLLSAPKIKRDSEHHYAYYDELDIPQYRACPKCYRFIKHAKACKHIEGCPGCGLYFCFICLGIKDENGWPCMLENEKTDHSLGCKLAPRQTLG